MPELLTAEAVPLQTNADGVILVRGTRVPLDTIVTAFHQGATAEEIAQQYPSVSLADVYQVLGYYLRHSSELDEYLAGRRRNADAVQQAIESQWPPHGFRARLLSRRQG